MDLYNDNSTLLMERFPKLGLLAAGWTAIPSAPESLPSVPLDNVKLLYIYGFGDGGAYFQLREWLHGDPERQLVFLEDQPGYIASFLETERRVEVEKADCLRQRDLLF